MSLTCPISLSYISVSRFIIRSGGQSTRFKAEFAYTVTSPLSLLLARIYCYLLLFLIFAKICSDLCSSFFSILYFSKTLLQTIGQFVNDSLPASKNILCYFCAREPKGSILTKEIFKNTLWIHFH